MEQSIFARIGATVSAFWQRVRSFVLGPAVVDSIDLAFGRDPTSDRVDDRTRLSSRTLPDYLVLSNAVYSVVTLRAALGASLPLRLYKMGDTTKEITSGPIFDLLQKVNPHWTSQRLWEMVYLSLDLWGSVFIFADRGKGGKSAPTALYWARPDRVRVFPHPTEYISGYAYAPLNGSAPIPFLPEEVVWLRYPNPLDEYTGLSPMRAAQISADYQIESMQANRGLLRNGLMGGGLITPKDNQVINPTQARELEETISRRLSGYDRAHRWGVLTFNAELEAISSLRPREMEFTEGLRLTLEDIARAYHFPLDLIGGQRSYENYNAARKAAWTQSVLPTANMIADDLREQLLPMFGAQGESLVCAWDTSRVPELQEDLADEWARASDQIAKGAITINEWRASRGKAPLAWGDAWWAQVSLVPVTSAEISAPAAEEPAPGAIAAGEDVGRMIAGIQNDLKRLAAPAARRLIAFGQSDHRLTWDTFVRRSGRHEAQFTRVAVRLFERQRESVLARLREGGRSAADAAAAPFDMAKWIKSFRSEIRPVLREIVADAGGNALSDLGLGLAFDLTDPNVVRFLEDRAQRFAKRVNETTWTQLKDSLSEGIEAGESITALEDRVQSIMGQRIASTPETIARTEVVGAYNGGTLNAWEQSGVVESKTWLAALDDRTRDSHVEAHTRYQESPIPLGDDFEVGGGSGPAPGQMGVAEEDIQCRCTMTAVLAKGKP